MTIVGKYVRTFAEATHALPDGMHMNADYPFQLPKIELITDREITISGREGQTVTIAIQRTRGGEFAHLDQSSSYERLFRRRPTRFRMLPFRADERPSWIATSPVHAIGSRARATPRTGTAAPCGRWWGKNKHCMCSCGAPPRPTRKQALDGQRRHRAHLLSMPWRTGSSVICSGTADNTTTGERR